MHTRDEAKEGRCPKCGCGWDNTEIDARDVGENCEQANCPLKEHRGPIARVLP